jgi:hypothetical protein
MNAEPDCDVYGDKQNSGDQSSESNIDIWDHGQLLKRVNRLGIACRVK